MKKALTLILAALIGSAVTASAQVETNIAYAKRATINPFYPDDTTTTYIVKGRISSPNFSTNRTEIYIQDTNDNVGIQVLGAGFVIDTNTFFPGVEVSAQGQIIQTAGVRTVNALFSFLVTVTDPTPVLPVATQFTLTNLLANAEAYEGRLIEVTNATISAGSWPAWRSSASLTITDGTAAVTLRIDGDTDIDGQPVPANPFTVRGIFTQFDTSTNANTGYQILPRSYSDIVQSLTNIGPTLAVAPSNAVYSLTVGQTLGVDLLGVDANAGDSLTFTVVSGPPSGGLAVTGDRTARYEWTPDFPDVGLSTSVVIEVTDGIATSSVTLAAYVLTDTQANIILNEFQYDPDASFGDANGDGTNSTTADEFVEIVNNNGTDVDLTGYQLRAGTNLLFTFPSTVLTAQTAVVVFGGGSPQGLFGYATVFAASPTWSGLPNAGSAGPIRLIDTNGIQIFSYDYAPLTDDINQSFTRNPDISGGYVEHLTANAAKRYSPGTLLNGAPFSGTGQTNSPPQITPIANTFVQIGQSRVLAISSTDNEGNTITLSMTGAPTSASLVDNGDGTGTFAYTGLVADAGTDFNVIIRATDGNLTNSEPFTLSVPPAAYSGFIINEYLPDPDAAGGIHIDSNNDGVTNNIADEFVEIVNGTTAAVDVAGMQLFDGSARTHLFTPQVLAPGAAIVVFGGGSTASFTNSAAQLASTGNLSLNNAGDSVILYSPATQIVDRVDYTTTAPAAASLTRFPDLTGDFTNHYEATALVRRASPGRRVNGTAFVTNLPPFLAGIGNKTLFESNLLTFAVTATDIDNDPITLTVSNAPAGSTFGATNGVGTFTWANPTPAGVYTTSFFATDNDGTVSETITITVNTNAGGGGGGGFTNALFWFDFEDVAPGITNFKKSADNVATGLTVGLMESSDGVSTNVLGNPFRAISDGDWTVTKYFAFTVTVDSASSMTLSTLRFDAQRSSTGPTNWFVRSSLDGYASVLGSGTVFTNFTQGGTNILSLSLGSITGTVVFRIGATNTSNSGGTFRIDNVIGLGSILPLSPGNDDDGDGIPNDWETLYFGGATNATAGADTDGDGFPNGQEYIAFTIPTDSNSFFRVATISNASGRAVGFLTATGRLYGVEVTTNLLPPTVWTPVATNIAGTGSSVAITDTNNAANGTFRINVRLP